MSYCTQQELEKAFGAETIALLLDRDGDGAADAGTLDAEIAYVDDEINGYLISKYQIPLAAPTSIITGIACDLVRYRLSSDKATTLVSARRDQAIANLKRIQAGVIRLDAAATNSQGLGVEYTERERTFTDDTLAGFMG